MAQNPPHLQRPSLRIGSIAFLASTIIIVVSTVNHPSTEDPFNHPLVFAEYSSEDSWIAVHIGQFAGVIIIFPGGFVALYHLLCNQNQAWLLYWLGLVLLQL